MQATVEDRQTRMTRWLHEAEQNDRLARENFAAMMLRLDGLWSLPSESVWPAISLEPAIATALVRGEATAFAYPMILGHTGPLLICSTAKPYTPGLQHRRALGVVNVLDDQPMSRHLVGQMAVAYDPARHRRQRIILVGTPRPIDPFFVRGSPGIYRIMAPVA